MTLVRAVADQDSHKQPRHQELSPEYLEAKGSITIQLIANTNSPRLDPKLILANWPVLWQEAVRALPYALDTFEITVSSFS